MHLTKLQNESLGSSTASTNTCKSETVECQASQFLALVRTRRRPRGYPGIRCVLSESTQNIQQTRSWRVRAEKAGDSRILVSGGLPEITSLLKSTEASWSHFHGAFCFRLRRTVHEIPVVLSKCVLLNLELKICQDVEFGHSRTTTCWGDQVPSNWEFIVMKFICLGFMDEINWNEMSEIERQSFMDKCFAYDDELRRGGHFLRGEALQSAQNGATVRCRNGQVVVTDGPYAETKEQLGGILFLEAKDLNQAIELMSRHPGVRAGGFEIRPANEEINALIAARNVS